MEEIPQEVLDQLLDGVETEEDLAGPGGLISQLVGRLIESASGGELTTHLGYEKGDPAGRGTPNSRNGTTPKTLHTPLGDIPVRVARDRNGSFEPQIVESGQTHWGGLDERIISMYAKGMTNRDIAEDLGEIYGVEASADFITAVTDAVLADIAEWQNRPLDRCYPVVWIDALVVKIRTDGVVRNRPVYLVGGLNCEGRKEPLSLVVGSGGDESAKFWLKVLNDLRNRGLTNILVCCTDGLTGLGEAIEATYSQAVHQTCVVHLIRNSLRFVSYKDRRKVAADLKNVYRAPTAEAAEAALVEFTDTWDSRYPTIGQMWRSNWERFTPFFAYSPEIRRIIYTTNSIEAVNRQLRKVIKNRGSFPTDQAALKLLWLALDRASRKWKAPIKDWPRALQQFAIMFPGQVPLTEI